VIKDRHQIRFTIVVASQSVIITTDLEFRKGGDKHSALVEKALSH